MKTPTFESAPAPESEAPVTTVATTEPTPPPAPAPIPEKKRLAYVLNAVTLYRRENNSNMSKEEHQAVAEFIEEATKHVHGPEPDVADPTA